MPDEVVSEMAATVWRIEVAPGDHVEEEDVLILLESMKMEIPVTAPASGTVAKVLVEEQQTVNSGDVLLVLDEHEPQAGES